VATDMAARRRTNDRCVITMVRCNVADPCRDSEQPGIGNPCSIYDPWLRKINFTASRAFMIGTFCVNGEPLVKITHLKLGQVGTSIRSKRQVTICAELDGPGEFMTITVCVPNSGLEREDREYGIKRAKEFAKCFLDAPNSLFPLR